ncbi:MAG: hypothetical protein ACW976_05280, partial [Candidatus Ranarchaeia archaeon]
GGVFINYTLEFFNHDSYPMDIIDVGFPNDQYDINSIRAFWDDGSGFTEVTDIRVSTVIDIGVEVWIPSSQRITAGEYGTLMIWGTNPQMVYADTSEDSYAGIQFSPTWFDAQYCRAVSSMDVYLHFPDNFFNGTLARWMAAPTSTFFSSDSLVYHWHQGNHVPQQFTYGISFPAEAVSTTFAPTAPGFVFDWDLIMFILIVGMVILIPFIACFAFVKSFQDRGRLRKSYLPPAVAVESLGLHRGLTVVEASILMETPLNRVVVLIIFGLLKKELITLEPGEPPKIKILKPKLFQTASRTGPKIHYYERMFVKALLTDGSVSKTRLKTALTSIIKTVARKMEGFSRSKTIEYYKRIMRKAEEQMLKASTPNGQMKAFDKHIEWVMLDEKYQERLRPVRTWYVPYWYHHHFYPVFWYRRRPRRGVIPPRTGGVRLPTGGTGRGARSAPVSIPNLADGFVTGVEGFANSMVTGFSGIADSVARVLLPPPPPRRTYSSSTRSGRSCACACACVSCACACAGGGR